jgi:hypothetical protein
MKSRNHSQSINFKQEYNDVVIEQHNNVIPNDNNQYLYLQ